MTRSRLMHWILCCLAVAAVGVAGCSTDTTTSGESTGSLDLSLELAPGVVINEVRWVISQFGMEDMDGTIDTSAPGATASVEVFGLPPGGGYTVTLTAMVEGEDTPCIGSADFSVEVGVSTPVMVMLNCKRPERLGGVRVNGKFNVCAELAKVIVSPLQTSIGNEIDLSALAVDVDNDQEDIRYRWTATGGSIDDPNDRITTYTCEEVGEDHTILIRVSDDEGEFGEFCMDEWDVQVACVPGDDPECEIDDDCGPLERCESNMCVPDVDCEDDNDCDDLEICNDKNECEAVDCKMDSDCGDLEICNDLYMCETVECKIDDDCGTEEICVSNVCWGDPDIICDTGICEGNPTAKEECVELFLVCIAEELASEEECIALSILACNECNENSDCDTGEVCNDNKVCVSEPDCSDVIDFEEACGPYVFADFGGGVATDVDNPDSSGINTTARVARMQKFAGEVYGGSTLTLDSVVDWSKGTAFTMKVWASRAVPVLFKLEGLLQERSATQTGSSSWEELCYDFTGTTGGAPANAITFIFDLGTSGDAEGDPDNWTFFFDEIVQTDGCGGGGGGDIAINGGFETGAFNDGSTNASWQQFPNGGIQTIITDNPSEGTYAANLNVPVRGAGDPAVDNLIKNANLEAGNLTPGQSITVTWDMRGSLSGAGGVVFVELFSEFSGGGATNEIYTGGPIFPTADWQSFTWDTTLGADVSGGVTLQLKAACGPIEGCGADVYFDNVTIIVP